MPGIEALYERLIDCFRREITAQCQGLRQAKSAWDAEAPGMLLVDDCFLDGPVDQARSWRLGGVRHTTLTCAISGIATAADCLAAVDELVLKSDQVSLTDLGRDQFPSWSADGLTIAYDAAREASQVALVSADGGVPRFLPTGKARIVVPKFSPDGRWILFQSDPMLPRCWIMSVDGGQPVAVTGDDSLGTWMADWSPDGTGVTITRGRQRGRGQLVVLPLHGGSACVLGDSVDFAYGYPAWSPDGEWVSFSSSLLGQPNVWIVPVHGGEAQPVTLGAGDHQASFWGRDSETIYYPSLQTGNLDVWSTTIGGDPPVRVTVEPAQDRPAVVSPDGRDLIFVSNRRAAATDTVGSFALWTVATDGGPPRCLSPLPRLMGQWSANIPDDASLLLAADHTTGEIWIYEPIDSEPRLLIRDNARCP
ncbi:MAG: hypothetical protein O2782_19580 [bacterium]|nr:hypothetical protein [bacterium]